MTDPDLVFEMDPRNVHRVEQWITQRWPNAVVGKEADGSRLTWRLEARSGIDSVVATESFLTLRPQELERVLNDAVTVCELQPDGARCYLLLSTDGPHAVAG